MAYLVGKLISSVCLRRGASWLNVILQKMYGQVNRKCPLRNTTLQLSTLYTDHISSNSIPTSWWCSGYGVSNLWSCERTHVDSILCFISRFVWRGYWHDSVVCLSVCPSVMLFTVAKRNILQQVSKKWIGSALLGTWRYNLQPPTPILSPQIPHPQISHVDHVHDIVYIGLLFLATQTSHSSTIGYLSNS